MNKRNQDRTSQQIRQIQTLYKDFQKILSKCRDLAKQLQLQLPNDNVYAGMERNTLMKTKLLDFVGLVNLKNSIAKTTSQLFDQERQFAYLKEKREVKEKLQRETRKKQIQSTPKNIDSHSRLNTISVGPYDPLQSMRSSRSSDLRMSKSIQIPIYKAKLQKAEQKMDRISKYIASLKKNIKINAESAGNKWRFREYLLGDPTYLKAKTLLERYLMREEEIDRVVQDAVKQKILAYFNQSDNVTKDQHYYYVKIKKQTLKSSQSISSANANQVKKESPKKVQQVSPKSQNRAVEDFEQIKTELQQKNENYAELFSKMNEVVQKGSERLNEIRNKRRQAFQQDDQLWDQL